MKNKLVFRILGALTSALIIVSVFLPFVSVTGYSQSLWQAHESVGTLYLPIMIIVFGVIGVIFFSINIKTELAYTSSGALLFFLVMQTVPVIDQGTFNTLSVGYYCLAIGTVFTGIMAFLCNLRTKTKVVKDVTEDKNSQEISMINQIDKLYNSHGTTQNNEENNSLDGIIQPLPVQNSFENNNLNNNPIVFENGIQSPTIVMNQSNTGPVSLQNLSAGTSSEQVNISQSQQMNSSLTNDVIPNQVVTQFNQPINNNINFQNQELNTQISNPAIAQFEQPVPNNITSQELVQNVPNSNPVLAEFSQPEAQGAISQESIPNMQNVNPVTAEFNHSDNTNNPVVAEFGNVTQNSQFISQNNGMNAAKSEPSSNGLESFQPLGSMQSPNGSMTSNQQNSNLDIFG